MFSFKPFSTKLNDCKNIPNYLGENINNKALNLPIFDSQIPVAGAHGVLKTNLLRVSSSWTHWVAVMTFVKAEIEGSILSAPDLPPYERI